MARSRRGPRTGLNSSERRTLSALKKAAVYAPKGTPSPRSLHRKLRQPGMAEVAAGRAKALKVGRKAAREFKTLPAARGRVIIVERPGHKVYARKGEVFEAEVDHRGKVVPSGAKRRVAKEIFTGAGPPRPIGRGRGRGQTVYTITVNGYPSSISFNTYEQAQAYARRFYQRAQRTARADPDALVVSIDAMRQGDYDSIMEQRESQQAARRIARRGYEREYRRRRRELARSVRPFR